MRAMVWARFRPTLLLGFVAPAVAADFEANGAPIIWRVDRAKAHTEKKVLDVLQAHNVLVFMAHLTSRATTASWNARTASTGRG